VYKIKRDTWEGRNGLFLDIEEIFLR
jgi:hypothetical protein